MRFDLTDLRVFLHACESGSMTEAASRSHLTLAAVSARIRALEDSSGLLLLRRHARGVAPTAAGEALARHARVVFHQVEALRRDLAPCADRVVDHTVLLANSSALARPLGGMLGAALAAHPEARIAVRESPSEVSVHALRSGAADLGIVSGVAATLDLVAEVLGPDPLVVVVAPGHALAAADHVSFAQVLAHDFIAWGEAGALATHLEMQAFRAGTPLRRRAQVPAADAVLELVARGAGVSVLPAALLARQGNMDRIVAVRLDEAWAQRQLLLCRAQEAPGAVASALAAAIRSEWGAFDECLRLQMRAAGGA